jgi:hypothetical protein
MPQLTLNGRDNIEGAGKHTMLLRAVLGSLILGCACTPAHALTEEELLTRLEAAGYSQIRENGAGKIKTFRAVKNGKEVRVILDSSGQIKELQ